MVDFYDSKLNPNDTTNAEIQACENDVAMVGTSAVFAGVGRQHAQLQGLDRRGHRVARHPVRDHCARAPVLRPVVPDRAAAGGVLDTKDQHPQTFHANVARGRFYNQKFGKDKLHGVYVFGNDSKSGP